MPTKEGARGIGLDAGRVEALTPKRRKVYMMANQGDAPAAIAHKLKITRSAVYSHMRHLRQAGLLPDKDDHVAANTNGEILLDDGLADQLAGMVDDCRSEAAKIEAEREEHAERIARLDTEAEAVDARVTRYERALEALTT